jgi:phosphatidylglycerophosphatase A
MTVATAGGSGYAPLAPGTFGSAVGVLVYLPLAGLGAGLYALTTVALTALGVWAADEAERIFARKDDGRIVIDEVAGQLITLAPLVLLLPRGEVRSFRWLVTGFVLFRLLDVWKPRPVRWAEQSFRGGAGVVLDDVVAGALAAAVMGIAISVVG